MSSKIQKIQFMRDVDIDVIKENVDNIIEQARQREIQLVEPFFDEFDTVRSIILDFIKKEKRIIYGGFAWNSLIKTKKPEDCFYKLTDYTDVEFYSNKPIEDMKKLCDLIYKQGYKFIQGKSAQHEDTYTIFVNFQGYCDISYMPSNIFYSCMTENIDGFRLIHPKFIMVDILRQFTDPISSFRRLDKNIKRGKLIMQNYPMELKTGTINKSKLKSSILELVKYIFEYLIKSDTILFGGSIATNIYIGQPISNTNNEHITKYDETKLEIISIDLHNDVKNIYQLIIKYFLDKRLNTFTDKILFEQYYQFFQFTDKKAVFKYDGVIFLTIYGNNKKCIPYNRIKLNYDGVHNILIPTFNWVYMFELIKFHQAYAEKNKDTQLIHDQIMYDLLKARDKYFELNKLNVLDSSIYRDFKIDCLGKPIDSQRTFFLRHNKKKFTKSTVFPYNPNEQINEYRTDIYNFSNYSGNIINNPKNMIYKPNSQSNISIIEENIEEIDEPDDIEDSDNQN